VGHKFGCPARHIGAYYEHPMLDGCGDVPRSCFADQLKAVFQTGAARGGGAEEGAGDRKTDFRSRRGVLEIGKMETASQKIETGAPRKPPRWLRAIVETLTPEAYREDVLGDVQENCDSTLLYIKDAARGLPPLVGRLVRRSFEPRLVAGEVAALFVAFSETPGAAPLFFAVAMGTVGLVLRDAYTSASLGRYPEGQAPWKPAPCEAVLAASLAVVFVVLGQAFSLMTNSALAMTPGQLLRGSIFTLLLVSAWRMFRRRHEREEEAPEEVQRKRLDRALNHTAWMNALWFAACLAIVFTNPETNHGFLMGFLPPMFLLISLLGRSSRRRLDIGLASPQSLCTAADPRTRLKMQRDSVWDPTQPSRPAAVAEVCFFTVLAYPLFYAVANWLSGEHALDWLRILTNFTCIVALAAVSFLVGKSNANLARALQARLDAVKAAGQA
jgi:hypothetical protein